MSLPAYGSDEVNRLLTSIDSHLKKKAEIILIGGTAALLAFKATRLTQDIDSFDAISKDLEAAYELAKKETGLNIPMSQASVADGPYNFESRIEKYDKLSLKHLTVWIPEIHDYILMKTVRGYQHDLDVIQEISKKNKGTLKKKILIDRFTAEMGHVIVDKNNLRLNFAGVLVRCFGEKVADGWMSSIS